MDIRQTRTRHPERDEVSRVFRWFQTLRCDQNDMGRSESHGRPSCDDSGLMSGVRRTPGACHAPLPFQLSPVLQDLAGGVVPGRAHHSSAGMRPGPAKIETLDGRAVLRPARQGPREIELVEAHLAMEDVPSGQAKLLLEI